MTAPPWRRRLRVHTLPAAAALLAVAGCGLAAGCGKSGPARGNRASSSSPASTPSIRTSQARTLAREINLVAADLPGFTPKGHESEHEAANEKRLGRDLARCAGVRRLDQLDEPEAKSPNFERSSGLASESIQSGFSLVGSTRQAEEELSLLTGKRAAGCLTEYFMRALSGAKAAPGERFGDVHVATGRPPAGGVSGSFALRLTARLDLAGAQLPIFVDLLGFADGRAEVTLQAFGFPRPVPAALEQRLYRLLLQRTEQHLR